MSPSLRSARKALEATSEQVLTLKKWRAFGVVSASFLLVSFVVFQLFQALIKARGEVFCTLG
jgi:hypothetical protein